ncbi:MAG: 5'/3'-nucleotidase SurE [Planctomycetes bacterium]|nr:5'/3'-nucleotidase SurE [Planctomycetota bacterium]
MQLLLTNDDGIEAEGLQALERAARELGETWLLAPAGPQSGCSHTVTTHAGVRIETRGERRFAIHGTPADCVRMGLHKVLPKAAWVLSGINHGGNLGADVYYSGTVAAVREGVLHGWPGIALSHYRHKGREFDWDRAARIVLPILRELMNRGPERGIFWNVNLPHLTPGEPDPTWVICPLDPAPLPLSYRHEEGHYHYDGDYFSRGRAPDCDVDVCFGGRIAVTQIRLF